MSPPISEHDWAACPPGELASLAARLDSRQRRAQSVALRRTVVACSLLVVAAAGGMWWLQDSGPPGGITCAECHGEFEAYHAHLTGAEMMAADRAESMHAHLADCPMCRPLYEQQFPHDLRAALTRSGIWLASRRASIGMLLISQL